MIQAAYSTATVAKIVELTPATVAAHCASGLIPGAFRTGGDRGPWRIPADSIDAYMTRGRAVIPDDPDRIQPRNPRARKRHRKAA